MSTFYIKRNDNDLVHHGVLGMKWGIRRYQNPDGSLTPAGQRRYKTKNSEARSRLNAALGSTVGSALLGPVGGIAGLALGKRIDMDFVSKKNLENDMIRMQKDRIRKAQIKQKSSKPSIVPWDKDVKNLYKAVNTKTTDKATQKAVEKAFSKAYKMAKRENDALKVLAISSILGLAIATPYAVETYKAEKEYKKFIKSQEKVFTDMADRIHSNMERADSERLHKYMQEGKAYTADEIKRYAGVDVNDIRSVGNDWDDKD